MDELIVRARTFATQAHRRINQLRKYTKQPYEVHLKSVAEIVQRVSDTPEMIAAAWLHDVVEDTPVTLDDVERTLGSPVLGVIPQNVGILLDEGAESPHAEAYRVLRTNLLFSRKDEKLNAIAVVSAGAGEGKSTTVFNLAAVCDVDRAMAQDAASKYGARANASNREMAARESPDVAVGHCFENAYSMLVAIP